MKLLPWFRFFRLPNLPTAPGDALAGAAVGLMWACLLYTSDAADEL